MCEKERERENGEVTVKPWDIKCCQYKLLSVCLTNGGLLGENPVFV